MDIKVKNHSLISYLLLLAFGSASHFIYELANKNYIIAAFFPIDESPFQHLKMIFFPFLVYTLIRYYLKHKDMIFASSVGVLAGMLSTLVIFYTYTGIIGEHFVIVDILTFFIGVFIAFKVSDSIYNKSSRNNKTKRIYGFVIFSLTAFMLIIFTYLPANLAVFTVPA